MSSSCVTPKSGSFAKTASIPRRHISGHLIDRRRFLAGSLAAGAAGGLSRSAYGAAPLGTVEHGVPPDASRVQGYPLADEGYGSRSQFETEVRTRF